ncbi:DHS-like NAD/FAD-binding domain-containing protein [Aspergillus carlsbadensis]|nr:DHS-like NAD/FAD-binding domain-containing protein [Aspergillus carlsbadensis]
MPTKRKSKGDEAANSAPKVAVEEYREPVAEIEKKAEILAEQIKGSRHFIVFTGAGISTSAGIPDFRGPDGNWTLKAQGRPRTTVANTFKAVPTHAHMALVELQNRGILKHLVSQNCDGLHRRSGIVAHNISELHGNNTREVCKSCGKDYIRDYRVSIPQQDEDDHRTGRRCTVCGGILRDTIINFGEGLPEKDLRTALEHANKADLCLVLGSSVSVTPASTIPETVAARKNAKLVICNLQPTALDDDCDLRIFCEADVLMRKLLEKLNYTIPPFELQRNLLVKIETPVEDMHNVTLKGIDVDGTPLSFIKAAGVEGCRRFARAEPFSLNLRQHLQPGHGELKLTIELFGHYAEPYLEIVHEYVGDEMVMYSLRYNPVVGQWVAKQEEVPIDPETASLFDR